MASSKYELKRGVILTAFGDASRTCTNSTITDELGDWYMKHYPEKAIYFARLPVPEVVSIPPVPEAVPPAVNDTAERLEAFKKTLKASKEELIAKARAQNLPIEEWENLNKLDLVSYLIGKFTKAIE